MTGLLRTSPVRLNQLNTSRKVWLSQKIKQKRVYYSGNPQTDWCIDRNVENDLSTIGNFFNWLIGPVFAIDGHWFKSVPWRPRLSMSLLTIKYEQAKEIH